MSSREGRHRIEIKGVVDLPDSPYPGLRAFRLKEWPIFFGRERMVDDVIDRIGASRFIMVHGGSGSGKSSLIRAGVIAQLQREHANRGLDWRPATTMPGSSPMWHFASGLLSALTGQDVPDHGETAKTRLRLNRGADGVAEILRELGFGSKQRLFILVDQFEEIFRFADEGGTREAADFIQLLVDLYNRSLKNVYVALTMRSDHLGDCSCFAGLAEVVNATQYLVPPMDEVELEDAIRRPAAIYRGSTDKALSLRLIRDSRHSPDQLPLVQHALSYMWSLEQRRNPNQAPNLDLDCYKDRAASSVTMALSNHADAILNKLSQSSKDARNTTERVFRALTQIDNTGRAIRRRVSRNELLAEVGGSRTLLDQVINAFARRDRSFLVEEADPERDPKIDISHEALIRHWAALNDKSLDRKSGQPKGWVVREASDGRIWQSLVATVESAKDITKVYLPEAVYENRQEWWQSRKPTTAWAEKHGNQFQKIEALFERSRKHIEEKKRAEADRLIAEEQQKAAQRSRQWAIALFVVLLVVVFFAIYAWTQQQKAERNADDARIYAEDASKQRERAERNEAEANTQSQKAKSALANNHWLSSVNAREKDDWLLSAHLAARSAIEEPNDGHGRIKDCMVNLHYYVNRTPSLEAQFEHNGIISAVFSRDERSILTCSADGTARLWHTGNGSPAIKPMRHKSTVTGATFSSDESLILTHGEDGSVRLWRTSDGAPVTEPIRHESVVTGATFNPDESLTLDYSADGVTRLWRTSDGTPATKTPVMHEGVSGAMFSPDESLILTYGADGTARLWHTNDGTIVAEPMIHVEEVKGAAFSTGGNLIATYSEDGTVRLWCTSDVLLDAGKKPARYEGFRESAFSPGEMLILTNIDDGTERLWRPSDGLPPPNAKPMNHQDYVRRATFSSDESLILTFSDDGIVRLWNTKDGSPAAKPMEHKGYVRGARFSSDESLILTYSEDETARLWRTSDGASATEAPMEHQGVVTGAIFNTDESLILTYSYDDTVRLWYTEDGSRAAKPMKHEGVRGALFSPDGRLILTYGSDGATKLWRIKVNLDRELIEVNLDRELKGHKKAVNGAVFFKAQASLMLLTYSDDYTTRLWRTSDGLPLPNVRRMKHKGPVKNARFNDNRSLILTYSDDYTARLWRASDGTPAAEPMKHESAIIGAIFNEDESLILTYSADGTARLWYTRDGSPAIRPMKSDSPVIAAMFNADFTFPREHLPLCVEAVTGTTLEGISSVRRLTTEDWRERKGLFEKTGLKKRIVMKTRSVAQR